MNSPFSLDVEAVSSGERSSASAPSARSKSTNTVSGYLCSARMMACLPPSPYGRISEHLTGDLGLNRWISLLRACRASRGLSPEPVREKPTSGTSGPRSGVSFAKYDQATSCLRTSQACFPGMEVPISREYSVSWPRWGSMRNMELWERTTPVLRTSASGSGFWPTPVAHDTGRTPEAHMARTMARSRYKPDSLAVMVKMMPTPTARSYGTNQGGAAGRTGPIRPSLETMARRRLWPTPIASDGTRGSTGWVNHGKRGHQLPESAGGPLNPEFVEWLMGWPRGWESLEPLAPEAFAEWLHASRGPWPNEWDVPRIKRGVPNRRQRLKALGNGQVPQCMAMAWEVLMR